MNNFLHQRSVEAKGRRDEENGLFIPRELLTSSLENFREVPKVYDNYVKYLNILRKSVLHIASFDGKLSTKCGKLKT